MLDGDSSPRRESSDARPTRHEVVSPERRERFSFQGVEESPVSPERERVEKRSVSYEKERTGYATPMKGLYEGQNVSDSGAFSVSRDEWEQMSYNLAQLKQ